ncbi:hypothetical protein B0F90DRAFT_1816813 [Multifurca ochricompacta]|uniref:Uncharacterized protein n=1 Tax=Multifurca ochricompacta TaxID=376703 RepID=A0AAD4QP32_9AGAM|nr:hypothetical protein B0F90DRAFT_1816813 [Multifurca ochricompacta]
MHTLGYDSKTLLSTLLLVLSGTISVNRQQVQIVNLTCVILSLSFILMFALGSLLARRLIAHRHHTIHGNTHLRAPSLPALLARRARKARNRASFSPTVSTLIAQSTLVASSPLRLDIMTDSFGSPSTIRWSMDFLCRGLERSLSWGRATIGLFGLAASASAASIQQSFSGLFNLVASPSTSLSTSDTSRSSNATPLHPTPCRPSHTGPDQTNLITDTSEPKPDTPVPDRIDIPSILLSANDTQYTTFPIPLIILSLPSNEHLIGYQPPSAPLDENLLSPDGTFRSAESAAWTTADTYDINNSTRLALASRLRERRKGPVSSPVLATLGMNMNTNHWPRWL